MRTALIGFFFWFIVIFLVVLGVNAVNSHSWYDPWCCNNTDCGPLKPEQIRVTSEGYHIKEEFFIPHGDERIRVSRDWDYHFCEYPKGEARCFYVPPGGS